METAKELSSDEVQARLAAIREKAEARGPAPTSVNPNLVQAGNIKGSYKRGEVLDINGNYFMVQRNNGDGTSYVTRANRQQRQAHAAEERRKAKLAAKNKNKNGSV